MKPIDVGEIENVENTITGRGKGQLFFVRPPDETSVQSGDRSDTARTKARNKIAVHRIFVDVDPDPAHE